MTTNERKKPNIINGSRRLRIAKGSGSNKKTQDIYDNIFQNIEYHIRELGFGDVSVNKNMKNATI